MSLFHRTDEQRRDRDEELDVMFETLEDVYHADLMPEHAFARADDAFVARNYQRLRRFYYEFTPQPLGAFAMALEVAKRVRGDYDHSDHSAGARHDHDHDQRELQ